jgi:diguanylate cyclase (GGDEF)-like protein/PAS domain S-box-containing protein
MSTGPAEPIVPAAPPQDIPLAGAPSAVAGDRASPERWVAELGTLLRELEVPAGGGTALPAPSGAAATGGARRPAVVEPGAERAAAPQAPAATEPSPGDQWARRRLGIAGSLFAALRCKHSPTAQHSLRVALSCSAWAAKLAWDQSARQQLEIAALLHDVGVVGAPDHILEKPGALDSEEAAVMARTRAMSLQILRHCSKSPEILAMVEHIATWYDGSRRTPAAPGGAQPAGDQIPLAARMIAVVEAFDAMTTDRVYRPAMSLERAVTELFHCAGTQFDPQVVRQFVEFRQGREAEVPGGVVSGWLRDLDPEVANTYWDYHPGSPAEGLLDGDLWRFSAKFMENMYDAVVFIDAGGRICLWNRGAERLTGIAAATVRQRAWSPEILDLSDEKGRSIAPADCPVHVAIHSGVQSLRRLRIYGRNGRSVSVDCHAIPVIAEDGAMQGAILVLHDASSEISLEHRCQKLADKATRDPLTQVANRAEFDRVHAMFIEAHQQQKVPCSLLMCDLDHFKQVNDTYGHQAGDDAIRSLAAILKGACRAGDLVARYGGEEFVMLLAGCDNAAATRRAEQIRKALCQMPQPKLNSRTISASFGVTEIQPGDTPETMLRRADRALLMAKAGGRNRVVQLGSGSLGDSQGGLTGALQPAPAQSSRLLEEVLATPVPLKMALEKLRGFVADHQASIIQSDNHEVQLEIREKCTSLLRRLTDRPVTFQISLAFQEEYVAKEVASGKTAGPGAIRTRIQVGIGVRNNRDRRRSDVLGRAQQVLVSLRSYLMAVTLDEDGRPGKA